MKEKAALISADELPTDVASGEALLDRHRQHKVDRKSPPPPRGRKREGPECQKVSCCILRHFVLWPQHEIDSYDERFQSVDETGQALLDAGHEASEEVREKVTQLNSGWNFDTYLAPLNLIII